jgi:hypothetical protein
VEFSEGDAVCCAHGANRPIIDTLGIPQHRRSTHESRNGP